MRRGSVAASLWAARRAQGAARSSRPNDALARTHARLAAKPQALAAAASAAVNTDEPSGPPRRRSPPAPAAARTRFGSRRPRDARRPRSRHRWPALARDLAPNLDGAGRQLPPPGRRADRDREATGEYRRLAAIFALGRSVGRTVRRSRKNPRRHVGARRGPGRLRRSSAARARAATYAEGVARQRWLAASGGGGAAARR
jgi:hypothetical protein